MLRELILKNRSYRRFFEAERIDSAELSEFIENARFSASTANLQPLRYALVDSTGPRAAVFNCLKWAGYLSDWPGPIEGERPAAYIIVLHDTEVSIKTEYLWFDAGLTTQHIMMSAVEKGYGGCVIASIDRPALRETMKLPERYEILVVLAIGRPKEKVVLTEVDSTGSIKYYRDADGTHFVPKRKLTDLIV